MGGNINMAFHWKDNVFFERLEDGSVHVYHEPPKAEWPSGVDKAKVAIYRTFDLTIDPDSWASIVASVSAGGEGDGRFYEAQLFHLGEEAVASRPSF